jgi:hypothetical protein
VRFHDQIEAYALPFGAAGRTISLFSGNDWADQVPRDVAKTMRHLIQTQMIDPALVRLPWLAGAFKVIDS